MAAPALRIPLSGDISDFKKKMDEAGNHVGTVTKAIAKQFVSLNTGVAAGMVAVAGRVSLVVGTIHLMSSAIKSARAQLAEMVDIANKAQSAGLSPTFYQAFMAGADGAEERIKGLQGALDNAFQALKPVLNPDWSVWDQGLTKVTAVEQSMRQMRELFNTDQSFNGLQLFRDAKTQDERIRAVLAFMLQLKNIGQEVAALDLGEKVFGQQFADKVRLGKESIESLYNTIERKLQKPDVPGELIKEAAELDKRLTTAWNTINQNLTPSWTNLALVAAEIKGYWTSIVELMARATTPGQAMGTGFRRAAGFDPDRNPNDPNTPALPRVNVPSVTDRQRQQQSINAAGLDAWSSMNDLSGSQPAPSPAERVPLPTRRPNDIPEIKAKTAAITEQFDAIERLINTMQRSNDILEVEYATLGKSSAERERGIAIARAEAAARAANRALTDEERAKVLELATAYATLNERIENLRPLASFAADAANLNRQITEASVNGLRSFEDGLLSIVNGTKSVKESFKDMASSILNDIMRIVIRQSIIAPIANALLGGFGGSSLFGGGGSPINMFGGAGANFPVPTYAEGTNNHPGGLAIVGERGPELLNLPRGAQVIPNNITRNMGGSQTNTITFAPVIHAPGATQADIEAALGRAQRQFQASIVPTVQDAQGRGFLDRR